MSAGDWPTKQEARVLAFPELARKIRVCLSKGCRLRISNADEALAYALIEILESKLPPRPEKKKLRIAVLPEPPEPPEIPVEPTVDQLPEISSPQHDATKAYYAQLIKSKRLIDQQERALTELTLSCLPPGDAARFRSQRLEHLRWQRQKEKLLQDHAAQLNLIKTKNKENKTKNIDNEKRWSEELDVWKRRNETPLRIVQTLRRDLDAALGKSASYSLTRLPWRFLPPSETGEEAIISALRDFRKRRPDIRVDESRLRYAYSLNPEKIFIGEDEFDGYFAFVFAGDSKVLLENPIEGNAAYIFGQDWRSLSKLSKTELLTFHHKRLTRVIHSSGWKLDIKRALRC